MLAVGLHHHRQMGDQAPLPRGGRGAGNGIHLQKPLRE